MASSDATSPGAAGRPLTDFEQVLLGVIADEPRSGYGLKKMFNSSPASVYQPSPARCTRRFGGWRSAACCTPRSRCPAGAARCVSTR